MDPSLANWGLASAELDLIQGTMSVPQLQVIQPEGLKSKQVRVNSEDLHKVEQIARVVLPAAQAAKIVFAEVPVGSQSARAMASYGICIGVIAVLKSLGIEIIEVTASEVKKAMTGRKSASKQEMIDAAFKVYPTANWSYHRGALAAKNEHMADAIGAIHAGVNTPMFNNLLRLYSKV